MTVRLVLENSPHQQSKSEMEYEGGTFVIGRGDDADWQLEDPDMYVSRKHCILTEENGSISVTDASSGGLFIDNATDPVGTGNTARIESGMRLRLGDFVFRVEIGTASAADRTPPRDDAAGRFSFDFGSPGEPETPKERPSSLPDPFGVRSDDRPQYVEREDKRSPRPLDQHDPFGLDLNLNPQQPAEPEPAADEDATIAGGGGGYFGSDNTKPEPKPEIEPQPSRPLFDEVSISSGLRENREVVRGSPAEKPMEDEVAFAQTDSVEEPVAVPQPEVPQSGSSQRASQNENDLRAALFRGMGLDEGQFPTSDAAAEMEDIGARMRELVDGLMLLLRARAQEKQKVRVAQTIISSAEVNPLKFLATTDEALSAIIRPRGQGYLPPQKAVNGAFRDLTDHQVRTWAALQTALRRMIDRFDPEIIEEEMAETGFLESLIAGGRSAKLWQLYEERYSEIAKAAEEKFLGEVGGDFRDAYEEKGRN